MNDIKLFLNENMICIVIISFVIFLVTFIVGNILIKKNEKERNEFVYNVLACAIYDSKHRINECEIAINENSK